MPRCVASAVPSSASDVTAGGDEEQSFFDSTQWSADGTCVFTKSSDNTLSTFVIPHDLLDEHAKLHALNPYASTPSREPVYAVASYPYFTLANLSTTLLISSPRDHPIRLTNALHSASDLLASYPLIHPPTERYLTPHSLLFTRTGSHIVAGTDSLLSIFDITRNGAGPVSRLPTIPSRRTKLVGGGVGMKGIVSALGISADGLLAAGTFTRCVGLYGDEGRGDCVAVFSVAGEEGELGGCGVTQVLWSPCGRYLYVVERGSDGCILYDVRVSGRKLGVLSGRRAVTNQRMSIDVVATAEGHEVWAGGTDGCVGVWRNPWERGGVQEPLARWNAHGDVVSSAALHPSARTPKLKTLLLRSVQEHKEAMKIEIMTAA